MTTDPASPQKPLEGKSLLLGCCGGIALYKVCEVVSKMSQAGAEVKVMMTEGAKQFVGPVTFEALSGNQVYSSMWSQQDQYSSHHINLARHADAVLLAPATANTIAKLAHGLCDNLVTTVLCAVPRDTPVYFAPAMNAEMWENPITQKNMKILVEDLGYHQIGPAEGWQACRTRGNGRMSEAAEMIQVMSDVLVAE